MGRPPEAIGIDDNDPGTPRNYKFVPKTSSVGSRSLSSLSHTLMNHSICIPLFLPLLYLISLILTLSNLQALGNLHSLISDSGLSCSLTRSPRGLITAYYKGNVNQLEQET